MPGRNMISRLNAREEQIQQDNQKDYIQSVIQIVRFLPKQLEICYFLFEFGRYSELVFDKKQIEQPAGSHNLFSIFGPNTSSVIYYIHHLKARTGEEEVSLTTTAE